MGHFWTIGLPDSHHYYIFIMYDYNTLVKLDFACYKLKSTTHTIHSFIRET